MTLSMQRMVNERDSSLAKIQKTRERVLKSVAESRRRIRARQQYVKHYGDKISVQRITSGRIDKGLTELTGIIQEIRDVLTGEFGQQNPSLDAAAREAIRKEARSILKTKFLRKLLKQAKIGEKRIV